MEEAGGRYVYIQKSFNCHAPEFGMETLEKCHAVDDWMDDDCVNQYR